VCVLPYNVPQTDRKHKKKMGHKIGIYRAVEQAHERPRLLLEEKLSAKLTDVV
jgi:hypothetical protein